MRRANISERLGSAFEQCVDQVVQQYGDGSRRAKLKLARRFLGMTQKEFASAFGLSPVTVRNWEADSRTDPSGPAGVLIDMVVADPIAALSLVRQSQDIVVVSADVALNKEAETCESAENSSLNRSGVKLAAPYIARPKKAEHI